MKRVIAALLLFLSPLHAAINAQWGMNVNNTGGVKYAEISKRGERRVFEAAYGIGTFFDEKHVGYGYAGLGIAPRLGPLFVHYLIGPALLSSTDNRLSTYYQMVHELGIGLKDKDGRMVGLVYKHFSNGGIKEPNAGRDFAGIMVQF